MVSFRASPLEKNSTDNPIEGVGADGSFRIRAAAGTWRHRSWVSGEAKRGDDEESVRAMGLMAAFKPMPDLKGQVMEISRIIRSRVSSS